jgi:hypothetical protein
LWSHLRAYILAWPGEVKRIGKVVLGCKRKRSGKEMSEELDNSNSAAAGVQVQGDSTLAGNAADDIVQTTEAAMAATDVPGNTVSVDKDNKDGGSADSTAAGEGMVDIIQEEIKELDVLISAQQKKLDLLNQLVALNISHGM